MKSVFKNNFEAPFLLRFICAESLLLSLLHYVDIGNGASGLDFNVFIIYNFDFIFANGDFF